MKVVLDACVLYPSVLRAILLRVAAAGCYTPLWSDRILEEWARATAKLGMAAQATARADIALMRGAFPGATVRAQPNLEARLHLPDENDIHVLAVAIGSSADAILTFNAADFPRHVLAAEGVARRDPDGFLWELWSHHPARVTEALEQVRAEAERMAGTPVALKPLLKKAQLPRLAKAVAAQT
ncbi:PIN domain-containing protein [Fertoebacter nigrum]|uniref:PIN domain-containing protein n=1 Tax=Fertoeibacter niger TaxID=2656921 RepID=A0A8X8GX79_9RHOB|nr:PIN domain-containing protein [Fertoeibacter niger]